MEFIITVLVTALVAMLVYNVRPIPLGYFVDRVQAAYQINTQETLPFYRGILAGFGPLVKYTPAGWLTVIEKQVYWAQIGGKWLGWSVTEVVALHLALAVVGLVIGVLLASDQLLLIVAVAFACPFLLNLIYLRAPGRRVKRQLAAELPEFVSILAAEVASETTLQEALVRLSRGAGMAAAWFRLAIQGAAGRSLFVEGGQKGALFMEAQKSGERDLINLARTLDNIKRRGTGTKELLAQTARDTASRFIGEAQLRAEKVGSEIILPMIFFFFMPYVVVILSVMAGPLLGGGIF